MSETTIVRILKRGGVGAMPTDTIYGLVASALCPAGIKKLYRLRQRASGKPFIILIGKINDLKTFGVQADAVTEKILKQLWPGPISVILPLAQKESQIKYRYLHRGKKTLAFRLPQLGRRPEQIFLKNILRTAGPLAAPSANPQGLPPARTAVQARKYFGREVEFYRRAGVQSKRPPSTLVALDTRGGKIIRRGAAVKRVEKILNDIPPSPA